MTARAFGKGFVMTDPDDAPVIGIITPSHIKVIPFTSWYPAVAWFVFLTGVFAASWEMIL